MCSGILETVGLADTVLKTAYAQGLWPCFMRQTLIVRTTPLQYQSFARALRLLACDVPDCRARGALKLTPNHTTEATHFASHAYFVNVCCPSLINEMHLQVSSPHAAVSLEHIEQIFKGLNVDIIYKRLTYIEVSKVKLIAAHVVIPKDQENVMWEAYGSQVPEVTIEYLTSEASMKIPTHAQRAQLESPLQHWQNYSNVHEVPASRLSFFRPADEHDTIAFERYAFSARSLTLGCDTIVTQEAIPIIHIHHDKHKEIPVRDLLLQALKNYPKKSIAGLDEIACELFADERKLVLLETPPPGQHNCSAYAIYQVTGRDTIRLPQFNTNKGIVHAAYSGTLALSNFDNAILVAPFRPDARHVYGASGSVSIDLIYFVQRLGQPEPRDAPIPSALSTAALPADSRLGSAGNLFQTVDVEDAVADRKRRVAEEMRKGLAAVVRDNPPSTARKATVDPLAANCHPHRNESLVAFSRDQPCQIIGGLDGQKDKMPNQSTPVQERRDAPEVAPPAATQPQAAVGEQREAQKSVPPPTTQQRIAAEAKRQQVLTNLQSIVCHVVCAFRVMSIGFIRKEVLLSSTSLIQKAFVAISAGLVLRDWSDDIKHGLANALFAYHPNAPMKIHSVNDTLEVAIPSLQTVTSDVQLSLRVRTKCACKRRLSKAEHLSRSAFAAHTVTLTDLGAHEDILKNFDSACKSSASLIIASTLRQATCQACHEVMSPDGLLFPKSFAFVLEPHTQAYNTCVFDLLGRELQLDDFSKTVYRVAALVIHSQTRQHYCTLEFADAGLAYSYDHLSGLRLVHRCELPPEVTANEHTILFDRWLDQIGADASVTTVSVLAASARHVRVRSSYIDAAKTLRLPQASSPFAIARSGLGSLSSAPVSNQPPIPDTVPSTAEEGEDVDMPLCETQNTSPNDDGRLRSFRRAQENNDVVDLDKESEENKGTDRSHWNQTRPVRP